MINKVCCQTGNRPEKLSFIKFGDFNDSNYVEYIESLYYVVDEKIRQHYNYFVCGGARGVDLDFAQAVIDYRDGNMSDAKKIRLEIAVPCDNQTRGWEKDEIERYNNILAFADKVTYVGHQYTLECMQKRNKYMVDMADCVVAFWNGEASGGAYNTIIYAQKNNKEIDIINLKKMLYK